jgi:hypothetical protein
VSAWAGLIAKTAILSGPPTRTRAAGFIPDSDVLDGLTEGGYYPLFDVRPASADSGFRVPAPRMSVRATRAPVLTAGTG